MRSFVRTEFLDPELPCLFSRTGDLDHIDQCWELMKACRSAYNELVWTTLPQMFRSLLSIGAMQLSLVEERGPGGPKIVAFCASMFVTDSFCREACTSVTPSLGEEVPRRYLDQRLPVLDRNAVASMNRRAGVNVMTCYCARQSDPLPAGWLLLIREKLAEAFRTTYTGYNLKEILFAPLGEELLRWALDAGFRLREDYSDFYEAHPKPDPALRSWLVGITREEALAQYGSRVSGLFLFTPPRFSFTRAEQLVLRQSLVGDTDLEIASHLSISRWTVKKRWQSIYDRVDGIDRYVLPSNGRSQEGGARGAERRRHLLAYLRQHLEELRPLSV